MKPTLKMPQLILAAVLGTLASAAAQTTTSTNTPAPPPQLRSAGPNAAARLEIISRVTEETLGADFDADALLATWQANLAKLAQEAGAMESEPILKKSGSQARPALVPNIPASVPSPGPALRAPSSPAVPKTPNQTAVPAKAAPTAWIDDTSALLHKALERLDAIRATLTN